MAKSQPLGTTHDAAMVRLKTIAARSGDALFLCDSTPHADWKLLDMCADALHYAKAAESAYSSRDMAAMRGDAPYTDKMRAHDDALMKIYNTNNYEVANIIRRAQKIKATTPAGIYAKALLVRCSKTGATMMAMSLATDLVDCRELRDTLWPAQELAEAA